jgi:hypothetical protein
MSDPPITAAPRHRRGRRLTVLAVAAAAAATLLGAARATAGSWDTTTGQTQAEAPVATRAASTTSNGAGGAAGAAQAFTTCMRSHGVPNFPGVTISADGRATLNLPGSGVNPIAAGFQAAVQACKSLLPDRGGELPNKPRPPSPSSPSALKLQCSGDCPPRPSPPKAPAEPS